MLFSIPVANMKLAMTQSPLMLLHALSSASKGNFRQSPDARNNHKQCPGIWLHCAGLFIQAAARRADIEPVEIAAPKGAARRTLDGHPDGLDPFALRRIAADAPTVPESDP